MFGDAACATVGIRDSGAALHSGVRRRAIYHSTNKDFFVHKRAIMSTFGSPGGRQIISKPTPPERGSFPLDHEAECQPIMKQYLKCLRGSRGVNSEECRELSKNYLQCRMER